ncbi:MAG: redox-sensing transcriptional repressor Rex [Lentisphaerae bacterium]|nr:redox-sensing transcriptional repressor Rex [Lentisphaerota bacterium]
MSTNQQDNHRLPGPVLRRFPRYLTHVRELKKVQQQWVSSREIAETLGLTTSTVRQDMSHLDLTGVSKRGYEVNRLEQVLGDTLGAHTEHRNVIIGAGLLGRALALHADFGEHGFKTVAIFDSDPKVIGRKVGPLTVRPMTLLKRMVRDQKVDIGVIAVPAQAAQMVSDQLVAAGIRGILNLAHTHLHVPKTVVVVEARILARMQEIAYAIRKRRSQQPLTMPAATPAASAGAA